MLPLQAAVAAVYTLNPVQALYLTAGSGTGTSWPVVYILPDEKDSETNED